MDTHRFLLAFGGRRHADRARFALSCAEVLVTTVLVIPELVVANHVPLSAS